MPSVDGDAGDDDDDDGSSSGCESTGGCGAEATYGPGLWREQAMRVIKARSSSSSSSST
jgi:hypothetical protein